MLVFPALLLSSALSWVLAIAAMLIWFSSLVRGNAPSGLQSTGVYVIGYSAQVNAYFFLLTDRYPHSSPLAVVRHA